jgi:hypothetical protein
VWQHDELQAKIYELMRLKCSALLPQHQHFLTIDFIELGCGPTLARQVWVANMDMAISVFKVARGNFCTQESLCLLCTPLDTPINQPLPPTQTIIASSTNDSPHIRLHSNWFAASSCGPPFDCQGFHTQNIAITITHHPVVTAFQFPPPPYDANEHK